MTAKFTEQYMRVYCRNCWAVGIIARKENEDNDDLIKRVTELHTRCNSPDIRATVLEDKKAIRRRK